jgi:hypothetical protein
LAEKFPPCSYNGTKAKAEFAAITGCSSDIPLDQGTLPKIDGYGDYAFDCRFWDPYVDSVHLANVSLSTTFIVI